MQYIDLARQQARIKKTLDKRMAAVLAHGQYIMGPEVRELEVRLEKMTGAAHCIACASGSIALEMVLAAWGIGPGSLVFTTPFSFIATVEAIARLGATPVFVDINPETYNIDPAKLELAIDAFVGKEHGLDKRREFGQRGVSEYLHKSGAADAPEPRAIITVDLFGNAVDYDAVLALALANRLLVLEDGAQGFGSVYKGRKLCDCGCNAATTSFFPAKPLGCYGDGGAVFSNDDSLARTVDSLRYHGRIDHKHKNENVRLGYNGRLDTLQAAVLLAKLEVFEEELSMRTAVAERYGELLAHASPDIGLPRLTEGCVSNWAQYTIRLPDGVDREGIMAQLAAKDIPVAINYPVSLHLQKSLAYLGYKKGDFPVAEKVCSQVLSLPMHPYLTENEQETVVQALAQAVGKRQ